MILETNETVEDVCLYTGIEPSIVVKVLERLSLEDKFKCLFDEGQFTYKELEEQLDEKEDKIDDLESENSRLENLVDEISSERDSLQEDFDRGVKEIERENQRLHQRLEDYENQMHEEDKV